jgi:hypothetical protein
VSARFLLGIFDSVYLLALATWVGGTAFFLFVVAPAVASVTGGHLGARIARGLLPRFGTCCAVAGAIALPAYVAVPLCYPEYRGPWVGVQAMAILTATLLVLHAANSLTPALIRALNGSAGTGDDWQNRWRRLWWQNAFVLAIGIGLLVAFANRPAPRSSGIQELSPGERARAEADLERKRLSDLQREHATPAESERPSPSAPSALKNGVAGSTHSGKAGDG